MAQAGASGQFANAVDAIAQYAASTVCVQGVPSVKSADVSGIPAAVAAAKAAEEVVLVVGQDGSIEHEGPSLCSKHTLQKPSPDSVPG